MRTPVAMASTTGRGPALLVTNPVRAVAPVVPDVLPVLRRQCYMMGRAFLNALVATMLMPLEDAKFVTCPVPAALGQQLLTVRPASIPRFFVKATVCQAVEEASTLTMGSVEPAMAPATRVWVPSPLIVPSVRSQRQDSRWSSTQGKMSPMASVFLSVEPTFTWRALDYVKLATHPASCVKGRALATAQAVGLPTCCWLGAASPSVQRPTLTRKVLVQSATHHAGSAMGLWNRTVYPATLTLLSPVGAVRPAARMSNS